MTGLNAPLVATVYVAGLMILCLAGLHIAVVITLLAAAGALVFLGTAALANVGNLAWGTSNEFLLTAAPLFILMGEILLRSGLTDRMYFSLAAWVGKLPGGLLHTNIAASALFAATSGSSVATAATIGTVSLPAMKAQAYNERLALGSIAAGGTLGILIPPSVNMIIYGAMTDTSIGRLFMAGVIPGIALALLFSLVIYVYALLGRAGGRGAVSHSRAERVASLLDLVPIAIIFLVVMGSLYSGLATATESAALGVLAALGVAAAKGRMSLAMVNAALISTVRTTGMIMLIVVAAFVLNFVLSLLGLPQGIVKWVKELQISPLETIFLLVLIYLILGCFLETLSMMITTIPVVTPLVVALGFDPVWFGIFIVLMCELALVTPPVGMNLFVVQGIRPRGSDVRDVIAGTLPFLGAMLAMVLILIFLPGIALWLPAKFYG